MWCPTKLPIEHKHAHTQQTEAEGEKVYTHWRIKRLEIYAFIMRFTFAQSTSMHRKQKAAFSFWLLLLLSSSLLCFALLCGKLNLTLSLDIALNRSKVRAVIVVNDFRLEQLSALIVSSAAGSRSVSVAGCGGSREKMTKWWMSFQWQKVKVEPKPIKLCRSRTDTPFE